ncbi:MAG: hypothetical protein BWK76_19305 [Desulfobulbaceae bacterium A2]|nr:MAG: hypothetical protein BWK76_19305 [Desulfobulbaceae bacterium A2]
MPRASNAGPLTARGIALLFALALHGALLAWLWQQRLLPPPAQLATVMVDLLRPAPAPPPLPEPEPEREIPPEPPRPVTLEPPRRKVQVARQLVAAGPARDADQVFAPPPDREPEPPAAPVPAAFPVGPLRLSGDLALSCPQRTPPSYPQLSRRRGEEGTVLVQVELDEEGRVREARVVQGSGWERLDEAALFAVRQWRCQPPRREGRPARAVALQPFHFKLAGN